MYRGSYKGKPVAVKVVTDARHVRMVNGELGSGLQLGQRGLGCEACAGWSVVAQLPEWQPCEQGSSVDFACALPAPSCRETGASSSLMHSVEDLKATSERSPLLILGNVTP